MDLRKCPRCGELYSPTYRKCPFCEEDDMAKRNRVPHKNHRLSEKNRTHTVRPQIIGILVITLLIFSWYLFGDSIVRRSTRGKSAEKKEPTVSEQTVQTTPEESEKTEEPEKTEEMSAVSGAEPPSVSTPAEQVSDVTSEAEQPKQPDTANAKLNSEDFTLSLGETFRLTVTGTEAVPSWSTADSSIAGVSEDGTVKALAGGNTTLTASFEDGRTLQCIVRVKDTASSGSTAANTDASNAKLNKTDFTIGRGEKYQLKVSGTTAAVTWSVANSKIASVASDGTVKGLSKGSTTVYAAVGGKKLSCTVRVK